MRKATIFVAFLGWAGNVQASPVTLICTGSLTLEGKQITIDRETAILDIEAHSFKPPMYSQFPLIRVGESDVTFGSELPTLSTWGSLDRISGSLSMTVLKPAERKKLQRGESANVLALMTVKCAPAQRMF
jgi:hypothetical protein